MNEFTEDQILVLSKNKLNYYLFLILVLKNASLPLADLQSQFQNIPIDEPVKELRAFGVLKNETDQVSLVSKNFKFPKARSEKIRSAYELFDNWDREFSKIFRYEKIIDKTFIKKISLRHLPIIENQLNVIFDLIRATDERADGDLVSSYLQVSFSREKV